MGKDKRTEGQRELDRKLVESILDLLSATYKEEVKGWIYKTYPMKTEEEIKKRIAVIEADERYQSGLKHPATIDINAPLALIQLGFESEIATLRWVLSQ